MFAAVVSGEKNIFNVLVHVYLAKTDAGVCVTDYPILCRTDTNLGNPILRDTQPVSDGKKKNTKRGWIHLTPLFIPSFQDARYTR